MLRRRLPFRRQPSSSISVCWLRPILWSNTPFSRPLRLRRCSTKMSFSSLTQVKDDSQLSLLRNLSSKGEKQSASPASISGQCRSGSSSDSICLALARSRDDPAGRSMRLPHPREGSQRSCLGYNAFSYPKKEFLKVAVPRLSN